MDKPNRYDHPFARSYMAGQLDGEQQNGVALELNPELMNTIEGTAAYEAGLLADCFLLLEDEIYGKRCHCGKCRICRPDWHQKDS